MSELAATDEINSDELPVWTGPTIPTDAQLIMLVQEQNFDFGGTLEAAYKLDINKIVANNAIQGNTYTVVDEEASITVPTGTVVPGYVESFDPFHLKRAQASSNTTKARFVILKVNPNVDGGYLVQANGFYTFPEEHDYAVGMTYYLSDSAPGGVTTTAPSGIAQPVFSVVDNRTIRISIGL